MRSQCYPLKRVLLYFATGRSAKYCDDCVSLSACVSVCTHISGATSLIFTNFLHILPMAMAWSASGGIAISYIFPFLRMMSYFHIMGRMHFAGVLVYGTTSQPNVQPGG